MIRVNLIVSSMLIAVLWVAPTTSALGIDLHKMWDDRCSTCHGHSGDFSRKFLSVAKGELQGLHHTQGIRQFLRNHYLSGEEVNAVYDMLLAQAKTQAKFKNQCTKCHESAAQLVRDTQVIEEGEIYSRASGRATREFLQSHRNLNAEDISFYHELLMRIAREIQRP